MPMIAFLIVIFGYSFVPMVILEVFWLKRGFALAWATALKAGLFSRLASCFLGVPITWGLLAILQFASGGGMPLGIELPIEKVLAVTLQAPWVMPYEDDLKWIVPLACTFLYIPLLFVFVRVESAVCILLLSLVDPQLIRGTIVRVNLLSYLMLLAWPIAIYLDWI